MTEQEILDTLDNANDGYYRFFVALGDGYSYLIATRLHAFRSDEHWAIVVERTGYNPRAGAILLDIFSYGNCLINLEQYNNHPTNYYSIYLTDSQNFDETVEEDVLIPEAEAWLIRGQSLALSHHLQDYLDAGIDIEEPDCIDVAAAARLLAAQHPQFFHATEAEICVSIPDNLQRILVLDEWYHKDYQSLIQPDMTDDQLRQIFAINKQRHDVDDMEYEDFASAFRQQEEQRNKLNRKEWEESRPGSYETWQQIAKVISTNDPAHYQPTLPPNTHWKNWPDSGSL